MLHKESRSDGNNFHQVDSDRDRRIMELKAMIKLDQHADFTQAPIS